METRRGDYIKNAIIHNMFLQYSVLEVEESTDIRGKLNNSSIIIEYHFQMFTDTTFSLL